MGRNRLDKTKREGEIKTLSCGKDAMLIKYINARNVVVKILDTNEIIECGYSTFKKGFIKYRYTPSLYEIGYIGEEKTVDDNRKILTSYKHWVSMLKRCYDEKFHSKHKTYIGCTVCKEWHNYSNFKKWFNENYYEIDGETMALDKDILVKENKIYSPKTCIFVPGRINGLFVKREAELRDYPIEVEKIKGKNKYIARLKKYGKLTHIGVSDTPEGAFDLHKQAKEQYIKEVADEYKDKIPQKLYDAMYRYEVEITD